MTRPTSLFSAMLLATVPLAAQWGPAAPANPPLERTEPLLGYDLPNNRMLMFGGNGTNEFWALQNGVWTQLSPSVLPGARVRADLAVDTLLGQIVLYGGLTGGRYAADETWVWDGTQWQSITSATTPAGLLRHTMTYDLVRQQTVLFGGRRDSWATTQTLAETWVFGGGQWQQIGASNPPPGRVDATMCYHPALQQVVMFGGHDGNAVPYDDTWTFDGLDWTEIALTGPRPPARAGARMAGVLTRGVAVLVGGRDSQTLAIHNDTWEHDGTQWRQIVGTYGGVYPARAEFGMAHDLTRDRLVLFGGRIANNSQQNDTWEFGAQFSRFGSGCVGSGGIPSLTSVALPRLGQQAAVNLTNLAPTAPLALVAVGLSRQQWAGGNLPALLTAYGMPNCRIYTSSDVFTAVGAAGGSAQWTWNVPTDPAYLGQTFHLQALSLDPGINAAGATVSNAATLVLGL